jgi:flagellar biosynthesis protein FlhG
LVVQLARELARLGKRTVLVDANLSHPQLADRFQAQTNSNIAAVLDGRRSVSEVLQVVDEGVSLLASPSVDDCSLNLNQAAVTRLFSELRSLGEQTDVVLVDAGHGMNPWVQRWWRVAQQVFLITTENESSVKESYLTAKLAPWGDADGKLRLVVSQCDDRRAAERISHRFSATCRRFLGLHVAGAPPIASHDADPTTIEYCQSARLLATEIVSHNVVVSARVTNRNTNRGGRLADMIAGAEKSPETANNPQTAASE